MGLTDWMRRLRRSRLGRMSRAGLDPCQLGMNPNRAVEIAEQDSRRIGSAWRVTPGAPGPRDAVLPEDWKRDSPA